VKQGLIGDVIMWFFLGAVLVLVITKASGFATAVGTIVQPLEYESTLIATAGASASSAPAPSSSKKGG
jgi:hypothetical protein